MYNFIFLKTEYYFLRIIDFNFNFFYLIKFYSKKKDHVNVALYFIILLKKNNFEISRF